LSSNPDKHTRWNEYRLEREAGKKKTREQISMQVMAVGTAEKSIDNLCQANLRLKERGNDQVFTMTENM
jgi:hypothetical protein